MYHLRVISPPETADAVLDALRATRACNVAELHDALVDSDQRFIIADVVPEYANETIDRLRALNIHHAGSISLEQVEMAMSDAVMREEDAAPGVASDFVVWEETEARLRDDAQLTVSYVVLMTMATLIAAIGIVIDSPVLIVGAMAIGPDYAPLSAAAFFFEKFRPRRAFGALNTLLVGLAFGVVAAYVLTEFGKLAGLDPYEFFRNIRPLTGFTSRPDELSALVALVAGVAGAVAVTEGRSGGLTGVLVSVTTIPAAANIGVSAAYRNWSEMGGAALQLAVNIVALLLAGTITIAIQRRWNPKWNLQWSRREASGIDVSRNSD